jgi:hypothetical protein
MNMISSISENTYQQVRLILTESKNLIEVFVHGHTRWYLYTNFESSYSSASTSVDYVSMKAIEITEFVIVNRLNVTNKTAYMQQFNKFIEDREFINIKFQKDIQYFLYSY